MGAASRHAAALWPASNIPSGGSFVCRRELVRMHQEEGLSFGESGRVQERAISMVGVEGTCSTATAAACRPAAACRWGAGHLPAELPRLLHWSWLSPCLPPLFVANVVSFNLDEYYGLDPESLQSYNRWALAPLRNCCRASALACCRVHPARPDREDSSRSAGIRNELVGPAPQTCCRATTGAHSGSPLACVWPPAAAHMPAGAALPAELQLLQPPCRRAGHSALVCELRSSNHRRRFMREHLFDHVDIPAGAWHVPNGMLPLSEVPR